jgi:hypothetical protein
MKPMKSIMTVARGVLLISLGLVAIGATAQDQLTPLQRKIEQQRQRLGSSDPEERRDALMNPPRAPRPKPP